MRSVERSAIPADSQIDQDEAHPSRQERLRTALAVCGKYRDSTGETRVAREHDRHLDEAYGS